jgi:hypothetical protein
MAVTSMKNVLLVLLGVIIGGGGFYLIGKASHTRFVQPDSSTNVSILFKQAVDNNSLYSVQELMTPQQKNNFSADDLKTLRKYIGAGTKAEAGASFDNYEVVTFGTKKSVTLWLVPPNGNNHAWQIQKITEGVSMGNAQ